MNSAVWKRNIPARKGRYDIPLPRGARTLSAVVDPFQDQSSGMGSRPIAVYFEVPDTDAPEHVTAISVTHTSDPPAYRADFVATLMIGQEGCHVWSRIDT
jgi:hypothetical protein